MRSKSSAKKEEILKFINEYYLKHELYPSIGEVAAAVNFSRNTVYRYLLDMDKEGMVLYREKDGIIGTPDIVTTGRTLAAVVGSIPCGNPESEEEYLSGYVALPADIFGSGELFILQASGDSMIEVGINDGDLLVIEKKESARDGEIVAALVDGQSTLKTYYNDRENQRVILHPENKTMGDIIVKDCVIQGVLRHTIKNF